MTATQAQKASNRRILVIIAYRDLGGDRHGLNAWPATGAALRIHEEVIEHSNDDDRTLTEKIPRKSRLGCPDR